MTTPPSIKNNACADFDSTIYVLLHHSRMINSMTHNIVISNRNTMHLLLSKINVNQNQSFLYY